MRTLFMVATLSLAITAYNQEPQFLPYDIAASRYHSGDTSPQVIREYVYRLVTDSNRTEEEILKGTVIAQKYINNIPADSLFNYYNIRFVRDFTTRTSDRGFKIFRDQSFKIPSTANISQEEINNVLVRALYNDCIKPFEKSLDGQPDYAKIRSHLRPYGELGKMALNAIVRQWTVSKQEFFFKQKVKPLLVQEPDWNLIRMTISTHTESDGELIWGSIVIHYLNVSSGYEGLNHQGKVPKYVTRNIINSATNYDKRFNGGMYNTWAWQIFKLSNDKKELRKALTWSRKEIVRMSENDPDYIDTYANLLYKLGRRKDALKWQSKAVNIAKGGEVYNNYQKMLRGEPTWMLR